MQDRSQERLWTRRESLYGLAALASLAAGCGSGGGGGFPNPVPLAVTMYSRLSGFQERPIRTVSGRGTATIIVSADRSNISINLQTTGLTGVTDIHIHFGRPGQNGPVMFPLFKDTTDGPFTGNRVKIVDAINFTPSTTVPTFEQAIEEILNNNAYLNIHTTTNSAGEIRGQIGNLVLLSDLKGSEEVPPVTTSATGGATIIIADDASGLTVSIGTTGLTGVQKAHIHYGAKGVNGPAIFTLYDSATDGAYGNQWFRALVSTDLAPSTANGITTFQDALDALARGDCYLNLHTTGKPDGELRGQILTPVT